METAINELYEKVEQAGLILMDNNGNRYEQIEYLESTGTQYVDTDVYPSNNTFLSVTIQLSSRFDGNNNVGGSRIRGTDRKFGIISNSGNQTFGYFFGSRSNEYVVAYDDQKHKVELSAEGFIFDDELKSTIYDNEFSVELSMYLFGFHNNYGNQLNSYRLYNCIIMDNGVTVRDYIPVLDKNDRPCLFDKVEKKCYYNQGTGEFLCG